MQKDYLEFLERKKVRIEERLAFELKKQYFDVGVKNMTNLEMEKQQLDIFSMLQP